MTTRHGMMPISCEFDHVYAFEITPEFDSQGMKEIAQTLETAFDTHEGKVNVLLKFTDFSLSDAGFTGFTAMGTKFRSLMHIGRYATVGAPDGAARMIGFFDPLLPVEARAFDAKDEVAAWHFVNER